MILLSSRKAEQAIVDGSLQPWEKVKYLILPLLLSTLSGTVLMITPVYGSRSPLLNSIVNFIGILFSMFLTYQGIKKCFLVNQDIDGKDFIERFTILYVPALIRLGFIFIPLSVIFIVILFSSRESLPVVNKYGSMIFSILSPVVTYLLFKLIRESFLSLGNNMNSS